MTSRWKFSIFFIIGLFLVIKGEVCLVVHKSYALDFCIDAQYLPPVRGSHCLELSFT